MGANTNMIGTETLDRVIGQDVYDESGEKIGSASEVYLDDETGQPEWVTVKTGLFGTKESFVPIRNADLTDDGLRVAVSKDQVKDAPKIDTDGHLSPQEEEELYRYYGMGAGTGTDRRRPDMADTTTTTAGYADTDTDTRGTVGHDTSGPTTDNAMTRSEERMTVGTTSQEVGRARLRKYVVTENVTRDRPGHPRRGPRRARADHRRQRRQRDGRPRDQRGGARGRAPRRAARRRQGGRAGRARPPRQGDGHRAGAGLRELRKEQIEIDGATAHTDPRPRRRI